MKTAYFFEQQSGIQTVNRSTHTVNYNRIDRVREQ